MDFYGLIVIAATIGVILVGLAAWLLTVLARPAQHEPPPRGDLHTWHPMLVDNGELYDTEETL